MGSRGERSAQENLLRSRERRQELQKIPPLTPLNFHLHSLTEILDFKNFDRNVTLGKFSPCKPVTRRQPSDDIIQTVS